MRSALESLCGGDPGLRYAVTGDEGFDGAVVYDAVVPFEDVPPGMPEAAATVPDPHLLHVLTESDHVQCSGSSALRRVRSAPQTQLQIMMAFYYQHRFREESDPPPTLTEEERRKLAKISDLEDFWSNGRVCDADLPEYVALCPRISSITLIKTAITDVGLAVFAENR